MLSNVLETGESGRNSTTPLRIEIAAHSMSGSTATFMALLLNGEGTDPWRTDTENVPMKAKRNPSISINNPTEPLSSTGVIQVGKSA